jgi:hypothetical protein
MTDDVDSNGAPHLSDEHLSWYVDGTPVVPGDDPSEPGRIGAHLAGCESCRQRLRRVERTRALIGTPVPPVAPAVRADAVSAAVRSWVAAGESDPRTAGSGLIDDGGPPSIEPRRIRPRRPGLIGAAAAVAAVLVVGVGILVANVVPSSSSSTASRAANAPLSTTVPAFRNAPSAAGSPLGATTQPFAAYGQAELGGLSAPLAQLGSVPSVGALRTTVNRVLSGLGSPAVGSTPTSAASAPGGAFSEGANGADHGAATPSASGPATSATTAPPGGASGGATQDASLPSSLRGCLSSALRATGGSRRIELAASAVYRGAAALVYVFYPSTPAASSPPPSTSSSGGSIAPSPLAAKGATVVVVARRGCGVLASTTL